MTASQQPIDELKAAFDAFLKPQAQPVTAEVKAALAAMFAAIMELDRRTNGGGFLGDPDILGNPNVLS